MAQNRKDPMFWDKMRDGWYKHAQAPLSQYARYSRWFRGEFEETPGYTGRSRMPKGWRGNLANLTNLATRATRADLFFRNPRFLVRPSGSLNSAIFTPELAHVETLLLNTLVEEVGLYREGRRALLDGLLGPFMVFKVGYSRDLVVDKDLVDAERLKADEEGQLLVTARRKPMVREDDLHSVHYEQHEQVIAAVERGDIMMPKKDLEYLKKHNQKHLERIPFERPKETIRNDSIFVRRRSPLNVFFDPWAESPGDREWCGERFITRIEDVKANPDFSAAGKAGIRKLNHRWLEQEHLPVIPAEDVTTPDEYCLLYEVVDLVAGNVIVYAHGAKSPLLVRPFTLQPLMRSGPYIDASFMEDPFEGFGVAPPAVYEAHQIAATYLSAVNTQTVQRSTPKLGYNAQAISKEELSELKKFVVAGLIPFKTLGPGMKVSDHLHQIPPAAVPDQNMTMEAYHRRMIEQMCGLGSAKMAGGDSSRTATASAIIGESVTTLSEDLASVVDDWVARTGKVMLRLARRFYTKNRIGELVGEEGLEHWPFEWSERDIANDRGVLVVPGSSRRNNTAVEQKLIQDMYGVLAQDPTIPVTLKTELLRRWAETAGLLGLDFDGALEQGLLQKAQMMMQEQMATEEGQEPQGEGAERPSEMEEPSRAGQAQGIANVGGGRVPTGAGKGDKVRMMRGKAKGALRNRV